ncbi:MAG: efflux RND transporter permease subunit [Deltaproteobacteria bacterium]|nr:efflux RND transporter permease subunit [Deltaproteobacteria bacterium]
MILSDLSIKKPVFAWMLMAALILFGAIGFLRMGISQMPDIDMPVVSIHLNWEGAAPEVMETEVVDPLEEALMSVSEIEEIYSTAHFGSANITAEFALSKDIDVAVQEIQTKIAQVQRLLPPELDPPIIAKSNPEDQPIIWIGLSGDASPRELVEYLRNHVKDRFQTIPGVGELMLGGFAEPNLRVWLDTARMAALALTVEDVTEAIENQHVELPAGRLQTDEQEQNIRIIGEALSAEELSDITIPQRVRGGFVWRPIRLGDIARIEDGLEDVRRISRVNGKPSIGMGIKKQRGANAVDVGRRVKERMAEVAKDLPQGMRLTLNFDGTVNTEENVAELNATLILAIALTSVVCWFFLGSISSTVNVVLAIPTAIGGAFMVMYFAGFTLNIVTLMALSLVIGIVVDDAIVVLENIVRHREMGKSRIRAALEGTREITFSVVVMSAAIIAIFLPVAFMKGMIGNFFFQFGVVISIAVAFSLLEAITLTPMRCSQFLRTGHTTAVGGIAERLFARVSALYRRSLAWSLHHRWLVLLSATLLFCGSLLMVGGLRKEMAPSYDISRYMINLQTAPGSSLPFTDQVFRRAEAIIMARPEIDVYFGAIGGFGGGDTNSGVMFVTMKPPRKRPVDPATGHRLTMRESMELIRKEFNAIPGVMRATVRDLTQNQIGQTGAGAQFPVSLSLRGPDWDRLGTLAETFMQRLNATGLVTDVDTDYKLGVPEIRVLPNREAATRHGVSVAAIARTIRSAIGGERVAKYSKGARRYDVRVSLPDDERQYPSDIVRLLVRNERGEIVRLGDVVTITPRPSLLTIQRQNRERAVQIFANVAQGQSQSEALAAAEQLATALLPEGYRLVVSGSAQVFRDSFRELLFAFGLGVLIAYMILAAQYDSFIHPVTVLLALPFSVSGAIVALWLRDQSLNMLSMIGILLLMGIVKKNSILLVDFANIRRRAGLDVHAALLEAAPLRLRPIFMTSLAIIAGALPAALHLGPGAEQRSSMATVTIGGVLISTFFTLYVVPCAYSVLSRLESPRKWRRIEEVTAVLGTDATAR